MFLRIYIKTPDQNNFIKDGVKHTIKPTKELAQLWALVQSGVWVRNQISGEDYCAERKNYFGSPEFCKVMKSLGHGIAWEERCLLLNWVQLEGILTRRNISWLQAAWEAPRTFQVWSWQVSTIKYGPKYMMELVELLRWELLRETRVSYKPN